MPKGWVLVGKPQHNSALPTSAPAARELPQHHPNIGAGRNELRPWLKGKVNSETCEKKPHKISAKEINMVYG